MATTPEDLLSNTQQPQAYIKTVSEEDAPKCPEVQRFYERWRNQDDGTLDNILTIHSCNPAALEAHFKLYEWSVMQEICLRTSAVLQAIPSVTI